MSTTMAYTSRADGSLVECTMVATTVATHLLRWWVVKHLMNPENDCYWAVLIVPTAGPVQVLQHSQHVPVTCPKKSL
jgi:hypothetical protein